MNVFVFSYFTYLVFFHSLFLLVLTVGPDVVISKRSYIVVEVVIGLLLL